MVNYCHLSVVIRQERGVTAHRTTAYHTPLWLLVVVVVVCTIYVQKVDADIEYTVYRYHKHTNKINDVLINDESYYSLHSTTAIVTLR